MKERPLGRAALLLIPLGMLVQADTIVLQDGTRYSGTFVSANRMRVQFELDNGRQRSFNKSDIRSIRFGDDREGFSDRQQSGGYSRQGDLNQDWRAGADDRRNNRWDSGGRNAIERKYQDLGGRGGFAGPAIGSEQQVAGRGSFQEFQNATIYWSDQTGAHEVHGSIRDEYRKAGGPEGRLGFPTSDEEQAGNGRMSRFENGTIFFGPNGPRVSYTR